MLLVSDPLLIAVQARGKDYPSLSPQPAPCCWCEGETALRWNSCSFLRGPWVLRRASGEDMSPGGGPVGRWAA